MQIAEHESRIANNIKPLEQTEKIVTQLEDKMIIRNVKEARDIITELLGIVKGNK